MNAPSDMGDEDIAREIRTMLDADDRFDDRDVRNMALGYLRSGIVDAGDRPVGAYVRRLALLLNEQSARRHRA